MVSTVQGLQVSVLGLVVTFLALGVFIGVIILLKWLFPAKPQVPEVQVVDGEQAAQDAAEISDVDEGAVVAAIAVALACAQETKDRQLGDALAQGRGRWWSARGNGKR